MGNSTTKYDFLLDNGILKNVLSKRKTEIAKNFLSVWDQYVCPPSVNFVTTPLMFFEYLGFERDSNLLEIPGTTLEEINNILKTFEGDDPTDLFDEIIGKYEEYFSRLPTLSDENIKARFKTEQGWRTSEGAQVAASLYEMNVDKFANTKKRFFNELAVDRLFSMRLGSFRTSKSYTLQQKLLAKVVQVILSPVFNFSFARALQNLALDDPTTAPLIPQIKYNDLAETVDTQIVHFAVVGNKRDRQIFPVLIFTTENLGQFSERLDQYAKLLSHCKKFLEQTGATITFRPGKIVSIDQLSGDCRGELEVEQFLEAPM